ncbi:hypothetical protein CDAR_539791 [Caerostris darwini]|uniref:Uncharacterized protein n=1 Tax=Caerostris darwini TaxID=1538125 RepID=A0AAV4MYK2_9ARAC|nr:hypothetical protein CDAR_539791 [Caerostris darwini]
MRTSNPNTSRGTHIRFCCCSNGPLSANRSSQEAGQPSEKAVTYRSIRMHSPRRYSYKTIFNLPDEIWDPVSYSIFVAEFFVLREKHIFVVENIFYQILFPNKNDV